MSRKKSFAQSTDTKVLDRIDGVIGQSRPEGSQEPFGSVGAGLFAALLLPDSLP